MLASSDAILYAKVVRPSQPGLTIEGRTTRAVPSRGEHP